MYVLLLVLVLLFQSAGDNDPCTWILTHLEVSQCGTQVSVPSVGAYQQLKFEVHRDF